MVFKRDADNCKRRKGIVPATNIYPPNERLSRNERPSVEQDCHSTRLTNDFEGNVAGSAPGSQAVTLKVVNSSQYEEMIPDFVFWNSDHFSAEQRNDLSAKGAISLPEPRVLNLLLQSYIDFVHPQLPFLDLSRFLSVVGSNGQSSHLSLLLVQAVLFAGALYIDFEDRLFTQYGNSRDLQIKLRARSKVCEIDMKLPKLGNGCD